MNWFERRLGGHITTGPLVIFGFNAMHVAFNLHTKRWGWICFHPPMRCFGGWWPWYFYISPNATPGPSTFAIGPGVDRETKREARENRKRWGHGYPSRLYYDRLHTMYEDFA